MSYADDRKVFKHESYGAISINRTSGQAYLFGSDAYHHHFVHIELKHAELNRDLSHNWIYGHDRIAELWMTEAQWVEFVSAFGQGSGVPCTLRYADGKLLELPPEPENFRSQFSDEVTEHVGDVVKNLSQLADKLTDYLKPGSKSLGKKTLAEVLKEIQGAIMQVKNNLPYIEECFDESMEKKMSQAKIEFESIVGHRLQQLGLDTLRNRLPESEFKTKELPEKS